VVCTATVSGRRTTVVDGSARGGNLYMATREDFFLAIRGDPVLATREDFFMATDTLQHRRHPGPSLHEGMRRGLRDASPEEMDEAHQDRSASCP
jgi:hypothetical protein